MRASTRAPAARASRRACATRAIAGSERKTARLQFSVPKRVHFGHSVCLVGSHEAVGTWDTSKGVVLAWSEDDHWVGEVEVPVGEHFEYKYFTQAPGGRAEEWQPGNNLALDAPQEADAVLLVTDDWHGKERSLSITHPGAEKAAAAPTQEGPAEPAAVAATAPAEAAAAKPAATDGAAVAAENGAAQNGSRTVWHPAPSSNGSSSNGSSSSNGNGAHARAAPPPAAKPPAADTAPEAPSAAAAARRAPAPASGKPAGRGAAAAAEGGEAGARRRRKQAAMLEALAAEPAEEDARVQARRARLWDSSGSDSDSEGAERPPVPPAAASGSESSDEESIDAALRGADAVKELAAQLLGRQREVLGRLHETDFSAEAAAEAEPGAAAAAAPAQGQAEAEDSLAAAVDRASAAAAVEQQTGGSRRRPAAAELAEAHAPAELGCAGAGGAAAEGAPLSEQQLGSLTVKQLKTRAKQRGLLQSGKKADLVARLLAAQH